MIKTAGEDPKYASFPWDQSRDTGTTNPAQDCIFGLCYSLSTRAAQINFIPFRSSSTTGLNAQARVSSWVATVLRLAVRSALTSIICGKCEGAGVNRYGLHQSLVVHHRCNDAAAPQGWLAPARF